MNPNDSLKLFSKYLLYPGLISSLLFIKKTKVGGAVLTDEIATEIDADYYTEDAMAMVNLLKDLNV